MQHIYTIGDIHGDYRVVRNLYERGIEFHKNVAHGDTNILICLGDFGGNYFFNYRDDDFKKKIGRYPFDYFVIRGNHEERPSLCMQRFPDKWHTELYFGNTVYVENEYPYIKYASDEPAIYFIEGLRTLVLPGAYSVDKQYRLERGMSWFEHEQMSENEMQKCLDILDGADWQVDIVLSHTCPILFEPTDLFLSFVDQSQVDKNMERFFGHVEYLLVYDMWLWGHYHAERVYPNIGDGQRIMLYTKAIKLLDWFEKIKAGRIGEFI